MPGVMIVADSNSGVTQEQAARLGIEVIPMPFIINDKTYYEGVDLSQDQFFRYLQENADVSTSQPSPGDITDTWDRCLEKYDEIVYLPMSSSLSNSCETAMALAQDYDGKVQVVDNKRISVPQYQAILDGLAMVRAGKSAAEIKNELELAGADFSVYITVDTLKYLKKGGRISGAEAALGTMLHIKPVLQLGAGKLEAISKCRGMKAARRAMIHALQSDLEGELKDYHEQGKLQIMTAYAGVSEETLNEWNQEVKEAFHVDYIETAPLTLSIACHVGAGVLGIGATRIICADSDTSH